MEPTIEQNKDIIICEYIQKADILKFSFPAHLSSKEFRERIETVAQGFSTNSHTQISINVDNGNCNVVVAAEKSCANISKQ